MIRAVFTDEAIHITGHAGYAENGEDIVCSAVSALCWTLMSSIHEIAEEKPVYQLKPGEFYLDLKHLSIISEVLVDAFFIGMQGIAKAHPEYVIVQAVEDVKNNGDQAGRDALNLREYNSATFDHFKS